LVADAPDFWQHFTCGFMHISSRRWGTLLIIVTLLETMRELLETKQQFAVGEVFRMGGDDGGDKLTWVEIARRTGATS
jgi:hypothetical protein